MTTATQITAPVPSFNDTDGQPLESGYVYIGEANKNPETNPIQVYWDEQLTIPAAQPLRTSGGYVVRNGTPSNFYVGSEYSITVRNKKRALVYTFSVQNGDVNVQTGIFLNVKDQPWSAKGDDATDDWQAIENAVQYLYENGGGTLYFPPGTYLTKYAISIKSNIRYLGAGRDATIIKAHPDSIDNVFGEGYPFSQYLPLARAAGGTINRLTKPDFIHYYTEQEALINGGFSGYAATNVIVEKMTIDGNKDNRLEGDMLLNGTAVGTFLGGEYIVSTGGATAMVAGAFAGGGVSVDPRTVSGVFNVGDTITGQESGATQVITSKSADDAYQLNIRLDGVSHAVFRDLVLRNSFFEVFSVYNFSNNVTLENSLLYNNHKAGTAYPYGYIIIYVEFDNSYTTIRNNLIIGSLGYGIVAQNGSGANRDTLIENNIVMNTRGDGIRVMNKNGEVMYSPKVIGNTVKDWDSAGDPGCVGIRVVHEGASGAIAGAIVANNNVRNYPYGILSQGTMAQCTFTGNTAFDNSSADIGYAGTNTSGIANVSDSANEDTLSKKVIINADRQDPLKLYSDGRSVGMQLEVSGVSNWFVKNNYPNGDLWFEQGGARYGSLTLAGDLSGIRSVKGGNSSLRGPAKIPVGTSATTIYTADNLNDPTMLIVAGDDGSNGYMDIILTGYGQTPKVVTSQTMYGSPPARTYSRSGSNIQLAMASGGSSTLVQALEYAWY